MSVTMDMVFPGIHLSALRPNREKMFVLLSYYNYRFEQFNAKISPKDLVAQWRVSKFQ